MGSASPCGLHLMLTLTCFFISTASLAHGTNQHIFGTITAIHGTRIEVKTPMGGTVDVRVDKQTDFKEKKNWKDFHIPMVGEHVIITATKSNPRLPATKSIFLSARRVPASIQPVAVR